MHRYLPTSMVLSTLGAGTGRAMSVCVKEFQTYTAHISDEMKGSSEKVFPTWKLAVRFHAVHSIYDRQRLEGDRTLQMFQKAHERKTHVELSQTIVQETSSNFR